MALPPPTPLVLIAAIVGSGVGCFAWVYRDAPGARWLAAFMFAASVWTLAEGLALASPSYGGKVLWMQVALSVSSLVPLAWLATVLTYADHEVRLTRRRLALLSVEPLAFAGLVWTNDAHGLIWADLGMAVVDRYAVLTSEFGLAFWAHTAYTYCLVLGGAAVLVARSLRTTRAFRNQNTALLAAVAVPLVANALTVFELVPPQYDLTGFGFVVTGVVVAVAVLRHDLMSVAPVTRELGREAVVDEVDDPVVIVDGEDRVVDLNPAAERLFETTVDDAISGPLRSVSGDLADAVDGLETGQTAVALDAGEGHRHYDVRVSSLYRAYGAVTGRVIGIRDVTHRRRREQRLDVLNRLLRHNLRNEMNLVRGNAELLDAHLSSDDPEVAERLDRIQETVDAVVARSDKIGYLSEGIDADAADPVALVTVVGDAVTTVRDRYGAADITADVPDGIAVAGGQSVERALEELLANAVEHGGQDPAITVTASESGGTVELRVADDGPGIADQERVVIEEGRETALEHGSGVGLWLVRWTVREHGGTVSFADRDDGTTVILRLPSHEARVDDRRRVEVADDD